MPPLFLRLRPLSSSSSLGIIFKSIFIVVYITTWPSYWRSEVHQQPAKYSKNYKHQKKSIPERSASSSFILASYASFVHSFRKLSSMPKLPPPSITRRNSYPHNTQTDRIAYPCIPRGSDGEILAARMQKGDD